MIRDFELSYVTHGQLNAATDNTVLVAGLPERQPSPARLPDRAGQGPGSGSLLHRVRGPDRQRAHHLAQQQSRHSRACAFRASPSGTWCPLSIDCWKTSSGLTGVHAVVGASMGGMQALQWGVSHPDFMRCLVAMTPMARTAPWACAVVETARRALTADPAWNGHEFTAYPERGWRAWTGVMSVLAGRTPRALEEMFVQPAATCCSWIETGHQGQHRQRLRRHRLAVPELGLPSSTMSATTPGFDGDTDAALGSIRARALILAPAARPVQSGRCARRRPPMRSPAPP